MAGYAMQMEIEGSSRERPCAAGVRCGSVPPTLNVIAAGMCAVLFLVVVALLLLLCSHLQSRRIRRRRITTEGLRVQQELGDRAGTTSSRFDNDKGAGHGHGHDESVVLVVFPGNAEPPTLARACPLTGAEGAEGSAVGKILEVAP